jgi:hypothetical protein
MEAADSELFVRMSRHVDGPSWRWALARREAARETAGPLAKVDKLVEDAADYLRLTAQGEFDSLLAARRYPEIHAAVAFWQNEASSVPFKILAIGGCQQFDMARRFGMDVTTIAAVEAIFFDVRAALNATDWIVHGVILAEQRAGNVDLATRLRAAFFHGPLAAELIVDTAERLPSAEADRLFDQSILLHMKVQEALAVPLKNEKSALEFTKVYLDYRLKAKKLELEIEDFRHRCGQELARNDNADQQSTAAGDGEPSRPRMARVESLKVA